LPSARIAAVPVSSAVTRSARPAEAVEVLDGALDVRFAADATQLGGSMDGDALPSKW
jgi:hypothetical protein